ncbi:MAG: DNA-binding protein [Dechloromonas sp.]|nr:MAG: DNA-binding protein [Dechloromonas sp.]
MDLSADGLLEDLAIQLEQEFVKEGIGAPDASQKAISIAEKMRQHWKGQALYIPSGANGKTRNRDQQIIAEFNGRNHAELAQKHGLSTMRIRQILWRARDMRHAEAPKKTP